MDLPEVPLILLQHLLRLEQRVVPVAEDVDQPCVKDAVFIVGVAFDARGEVLVAMKACGLLQDCAEHVEVMGVQPAIAFHLVDLSERGHMVEKWRIPGLA